jgi:NAD dependent epimerase/dehydratase family enzyme
MLFLLEHDLPGPVNLTAPRPVTVKEFAATLGRAVRKPAILPAPALALRMGLGQAASALLDLQRVVPRRALGAGYEFEFPELDEALRDLVAGNED